MNELNTFIDTTRQYTAAPDAIPAIDRTQQVNLGVEIANRAAHQPPPPPPMPAMPPIIPIAN